MKIFHNVHGWINSETPEEGEKYLVAHGGKLVDGILVGHGSHTSIYKVAVLADAQQERISLIKQEANTRISALDWKVTKFSERKQRGRASQADFDAALDEREDIRLASDAAEAAAMLLTDIDEIRNLTW